MRLIPRPWLVAGLFFCSGVSGLVYQTVWMRMLERGFGVTVQATSTIVAVFMVGLALGAVQSSRWSRLVASGLRGYAVAELVVGLSAIVMTAAVKFVPQAMAELGRYTHVEDGFGQLVARVLVTLAIFLAPTTAMGITLPLLVNALQDWRTGASSTALLYGINTLGAVTGVLLTGFVLIAYLGETGTVWAGAGLNLVLAALAWSLAGDAAPEESSPPPCSSAPPLEVLLGVVIPALCGFISIALEVVWTRLLVLLIGSSVYAFSLMLGSFLLGTGAGSLFAYRFRLEGADAARRVGWLLLAVACVCAASLKAYAYIGGLCNAFEYLYSPLIEVADLARFAGVAAVLVVPTTFLFGAVFPLCVAAASPTVDGSVTGRVYAWNTAGGVVGSLSSGFLLIPWLTAQGVVGAAVGALLLAGAAVLLLRSPESQRPQVVGGCVAAVVLVGLIIPVDNICLQILSQRLPGSRFIRHTDGPGASVTIVDPKNLGGLGRSLLINGILTSSPSLAGEFMADLPLLLQDRPRQALVICLGVGDSARTAVDHLKRVDPQAQIEIVELQQAVVDAIPLFQRDGGATLHQSGVDIYTRDGRHHLLMSQRKYDLIMIDTTPPFYGSGAVNLYSRDFQALARDHLTETGILMQWLPTPAFERDLWAVVRSSQETFPHQALWVNSTFSGAILMSSKSPIVLDPQAYERRRHERGLDQLKRSQNLLFVAAGWIDPQWVAQRVAQVSAVTDDWPLTEYPLSELWQRHPMFYDFTELIPAAAHVQVVPVKRQD